MRELTPAEIAELFRRFDDRRTATVKYDGNPTKDPNPNGSKPNPDEPGNKGATLEPTE